MNFSVTFNPSFSVTLSSLSLFFFGFVSNSQNSDSEPPSNRDRIPLHEREAACYKASHSLGSPAAGSVSVVGQPFDFERPVGVLSSPYCFWKFDIHPENIPLWPAWPASECHCFKSKLSFARVFPLYQASIETLSFPLPLNQLMVNMFSWNWQAIQTRTMVGDKRLSF